MSDSTRTSGRMEFSPALTWGQYRDAIEPFYEHKTGGRAGASMLAISETAESVDTDQGQLNIRTAHAVVPRYPYPEYDAHGKTYHLEAELATLARLAWEAGSELTGALYTISDSDGHGIQRWTIGYSYSQGRQGYGIESYPALLVWPDGTAAHVDTGNGMTIGTGDPVFTPRLPA